ncbi:MAG: hypothetical protein ACO1RX_06325 [Candidatus Sericytochromatia bacterium]
MSPSSQAASVLHQARALAASGDLAAACALLTQGLAELAPDAPARGVYWHQLGRWQQQCDAHAEAATAFEAAIAAKEACQQSSGKSWHQLGRAREALGNTLGAQSAYLSALEHLQPPETGLSWYQLAGLYQREKQDIEAIQALEQALKNLDASQQPRLRADALYRQAESWSRLGEKAAACQAYAAAQVLYGQLNVPLWSGMSHLRLAMLSLRPDALDAVQERVLMAIAELERTREMSALGVAYDLAGDLCRLRGQRDQAQHWQHKREALVKT